MKIWKFALRSICATCLVSCGCVVFGTISFVEFVRKPTSIFHSIKEVPWFIRDMYKGWMEIVFDDGPILPDFDEE